MEIILSALSAGGLVGASNQYMCLLIIAIAARLDWIALTPQVAFMESWWFIALVSLFWLLTVLPAYGSLVGPGVVNAVNAVINFLSGFAVPFSAALLTLASVGVISTRHPELLDVLRTLRLFDSTGQRIGATGWLMAGGAAVTAAALTGAKFLAKPALSTASGTTGTTSASIYATVENLAALLLMIVGYWLMSVDPWLLVALFALVIVSVLGILVWAIYQLWRLGKGIGQVIRLVEERPIDGWSVVAEFFVWGSGWLLQRYLKRGIVRLICWAIWMALVVLALPAAGSALAVALAPVPLLEFVPVLFTVAGEGIMVTIGVYAGLRSARALLRTLCSGMDLAAERTARVSAPA